MTISSRTPDGIPHRCPVCEELSSVGPSYPGGDACCPSCGHLLWWFRDRFERGAGPSPHRITLSSAFAEAIGVTSLDAVELVMELEEQFDLTIPDDEAEQLRTVRDAIRYIQRHKRK